MLEAAPESMIRFSGIKQPVAPVTGEDMDALTAPISLMSAGLAPTFLSFEDVPARVDAAQAPAKVGGPYKKRGRSAIA